VKFRGMRNCIGVELCGDMGELSVVFSETSAEERRS